MTPLLGAVLMVRDEEGVVGAAIASARAAGAGAFTVLDTGSSDGTIAEVRAACRGIPLRLAEARWTDFGTGRSEALALARGSARWLLALDADMTVEADPGWEPADPGVDALAVEMGRGGPLRWRLPLVLRGGLPWRSVGAVHEYTCLPGRAHRSEPTDRVRVRFPDRSGPAKTAWHLSLLRGAHERDPADPRTLFYLAQTLRESGEEAEAREAYRRRAGMGGWEEEAWYADYRAALLDPWPARLASLLAAWRRRPARMEPAAALLRDLNAAGLHDAAHRLGAGLPTPVPPDSLFIHLDAWEWRVDLERAVAAWWAGDRALARSLNRSLLGRDLPPGAREAVERNAAFD